jgi:hypothetical protein
MYCEGIVVVLSKSERLRIATETSGASGQGPGSEAKSRQVLGGASGSDELVLRKDGVLACWKMPST